ncbi:putative uncharacterized protein [Mycolicibacterium thermoresistibile]|uniref:DUF5666 domain-containing protein n=1 Tax=Mycolicibacterium thermoresistibile TaxID=1797 RepID=A0A100XHI0_MYCTH|nr:putative uncharacterized protein [Mycolicibacterium thermoresistibile]
MRRDLMKLFRTITLVGTVVPLAMACQGSPSAEQSAEGGTLSDAPAATAVIEQSGFGGSGDYLWVTSTVRDVPVGQFATVSFNLFGADGALLATESQVEQAVNPGARITVGTQVSVPNGQPVTRVEPTLEVSDHPQTKPVEFSDVVLEVGPVTIGQDTFGSPTADAELTNPSDQQIPAARVGVICFDPHGQIIGGGSEFPDVVPANGKVKVSARLVVTGIPDRCEMTAQPSAF